MPDAVPRELSNQRSDKIGPFTATGREIFIFSRLRARACVTLKKSSESKVEIKHSCFFHSHANVL